SGCKKETIPENDMVLILSEVFITDAVVSTSKHSFRFSKRDSIEYYAPIYTKMGYTDEQFIATMNYFFDNPKIFDLVLDKVVNRLSVMEAELEASITKEEAITTQKLPVSKELPIDSMNLWDKKSVWTFPADGDQDSLHFKIPIKKLGTYTLSALVNVSPNDESIEPRTALWLTRDSSGIRDGLRMKRYMKGEVASDVSLSLTVTDSSYTHVEGVVLGHIPQQGDWKKFAEVSDIEITYLPPHDAKTKKRRILLRDSIKFMGQEFKKVE
ncbi:MAG TPA: DUF4296 domain-containing protein, partial [Perlabentimonas sp.]|nr:DUF4296 domain-containing protein [Perlabentimonas sp.]